MPRRIPSYRCFKPKNLGLVVIDGHQHYLGKYGTPESIAEYNRLLQEWMARGAARPSSGDGGPGLAPSPDPTVDEVILAFWKHAEAHYRAADGSPTGEANNFREALRPVRRLYGHTRASQFGPLALRVTRDEMVKSGLARTTVNARVNRVRRVFKWAASLELIPVSVPQGLATVAGLQKGRTPAPEAAPVRPVADADVNAVRPFLTRQVWTMVELQRLTAARSGEVARIRSGDIDRSGEVWVYRPRGHKTEHHGKGREIYLGPRAIEAVRPWLRADPDAFLFQPREAVEEWKAAKRRARKTPLTPSQRARVARGRSDRAPGDHYDSRAYAHAVARACDRAFPHPTIREAKGRPLTEAERAELAAWRKSHRWHPHQLRHSAATAIRARFGLEAAQIVLGHARADVTQIYAERDRSKARDVIAEFG